MSHCAEAWIFHLTPQNSPELVLHFLIPCHLKLAQIWVHHILASSLLLAPFYFLVCYNYLFQKCSWLISKLFSSWYLSGAFQITIHCFNTGPFTLGVGCVALAFSRGFCLSHCHYCCFVSFNHCLCNVSCHALLKCHFLLLFFSVFLQKCLLWDCLIWVCLVSIFSVFLSVPYMRLLLLLTPCNVICTEGW